MEPWEWQQIVQERRPEYVDPYSFWVGRIPTGLDTYRLGPFTVYVAQSLEAADVAVNQVLRSQDQGGSEVLGLDLEWRPDFARGESNPVSLLQLASETEVALLQVSQFSYTLPRNLWQGVLGNGASYVAVMGWGSSDRQKFEQTFGFQPYCKLIELQGMARQLGHQQVGLAALAEHYLTGGLKFKKPRHVTMSNWANRYLDQDQIKYAALDALCTQALYVRMA
mmetsp:Transcript_11126/g.23977  ORF Transcript_11126/g.23977 Transcript_11126/m.23977 type:complete len:223 (+) Transcript_11126:211-879(+)|eukprot:CAMPEP_0202897072 /NCGR_PEP_ID=MMETSP1392-20130828/5928_1 /ASSEMBLY_ACC=CAM_ASM_000868 /TAXON_ID=225041 /ORGANISM="Chlamydomonas chlamydogama, Strain SAG 11-48b" /LENGTH=222 /DNA_ID=CAMNT_0049582625 /DNA_START=117 /DNA_END=785 /DNA_ORIENTATION=+